MIGGFAGRAEKGRGRTALAHGKTSQSACQGGGAKAKRESSRPMLFERGWTTDVRYPHRIHRIKQVDGGPGVGRHPTCERRVGRIHAGTPPRHFTVYPKQPEQPRSSDWSANRIQGPSGERPEFRQPRRTDEIRVHNRRARAYTPERGLLVGAGSEVVLKNFVPSLGIRLGTSRQIEPF